MLLATDTDDCMDNCIALLSRFAFIADLYESGAQTPKRMEAAAASTPVIHFVAKMTPLSRRRREAGLGDVLVARDRLGGRESDSFCVIDL